MERGVKSLFAALGIQFVAKNFAMGGTSSGEEVALCTESIFGQDIDFLTWDYGMTDADRLGKWKQLLYTYHTALGKNRPGALGLFLEDDRTRIKIYSELEELGMVTFYQDTKVLEAMKQGIPDTQGLTDDQISKMPPYVKNFRCGVSFENGDPGCTDAKYNKTACLERKGYASWHPGWKMHALVGNSLALFLAELLKDAVKDIALMSSDEDLQSVVNSLIADEKEDYARVLNSPIPDKLSPIANWMTGEDQEKIFAGSLSFRELYRRRSFCHTALLPAEIRFNGLLTQSPKAGLTSYDTGIPQPKPEDTPPEVDSGEMRLAFDPNERQNDCPYTLIIDYKDFFFLSSVEGWKTLSLPNDDEAKYYNVDTSEILGLIIICLIGCDWGKCKDGDLRNDFDKGPLTMLVNDAKVVEYTKIGICWALKGEGAFPYKWAPNAAGKYEIKARLDYPANSGPFSFVRFSSFIIV
jgi:hypothetical protein